MRTALILISLAPLAVLAMPAPSADAVERTVTLTSNSVRRSAKPGDAVQVDSEEFVLKDSGEDADEHHYQTVRLSLPKGGPTPALDALNLTVRRTCFDGELEKPSFDEAAAFEAIRQRWLAEPFLTGLRGASARMLVNRGSFVAVETCEDWLGAYPSVNCQQHLLQLDTGKEWQWLDGIKPSKRKAFFAWCSQKLKKERAKAMRTWPADEDWSDNPYYGTFKGACTEKTVRFFFNITKEGEAFLDMGNSLPHTVQGWRYSVALPAAELKPFVDPKGPLADAAGIAR